MKECEISFVTTHCTHCKKAFPDIFTLTLQERMYTGETHLQSLRDDIWDEISFAIIHCKKSFSDILTLTLYERMFADETLYMQFFEMTFKMK